MKRIATIVLGPNGQLHPAAAECVYKTIEIETADDKQLTPIAVGIENIAGLPGEKKSDNRYHASGTIIDGRDVDEIDGKLLTYIDATYQDKEQRQAHKDIARQTVWNWFKSKRTDGENTVAFAQN